MKKQINTTEPVRIADQKNLLKELEHARAFLLIQEEDMEHIKQKIKKHELAIQ